MASSILPHPRKLIAAPILAAALLSACATGDGEDRGDSSSSASSAPALTDADLRPVIPGEPADCPYLANDFIEQANGQIVTEVRTDLSFDPPACVFRSFYEEPQATVMVRKLASKEQAMQVVDWAAPIDATEPASKDGWRGGRGILGDLSVYAVFKDSTAVVVWSDQLQTVKAELIAHEAIKNLKL